MAERAAYLADEVLPQIPVRQWVLMLRYRLHYRLAWDHALCRAGRVCPRAARLLPAHRTVARPEVHVLLAGLRVKMAWQPADFEHF